MALKSILVALTSGSSAQAAIKAAAMIARTHEAELVGLHVIDLAPFVFCADIDVPASILEVQEKKLRADAATIEASFKKICADAGVESRWRCIEGRTQHLIDRHARYCDLLCVSEPLSVADALSAPPIGEELVFSTGRALLMVPQAFQATSVGEHVVIAWNGSREAAKAISHAMPILSRAKKVSMVTVTDRDFNPAQAAVIDADMGHYLARHGVVADAQSVAAGSVPAGQFLHDWAHEQGADLLVMGAYGHTRIREFILGGATLWTLRNSTLPVLMAH